MSSCNRRRVLLPLALAGLLAACGGTSPTAEAQDLFAMFRKPETRIADDRMLPAAPATRFGPDRHARILVVGDSLADGFGAFLRTEAERREIFADVINRGRTSTGLARSDFYDWPAAFAAQTRELRPDIVVAHFGANDMQTIILPDGRATFGTEAWEPAYRAQVNRILDIAAQAGAMVVWIGPAPDGGTNLNRHLAALNPLFRSEVEPRGGLFLPLSPFTAGPNGEYVTTVEIDGTSRRIRTGDGSHFTGTGYTLVADRILGAIETRAPSIFTAPEPDLLVALQ